MPSPWQRITQPSPAQRISALTNPNVLGRITNLFWRGPLPKATPMKEMGVSGTAVWGGLVLTHEKKSIVAGVRRWITYSDLMVNTSIVAASLRYFLDLVSYAKWSLEPVNDKPEAQDVADFIDSVINGMDLTPWRRVVRRSAMYRFYGFGIQEWTACRRKDDKKIGFANIEARPQHTIERWETDETGTVQGVWQRSPMGGAWLFLPRSKVIYMVEDSLTDSPEGIGLARHCVEPWERLNKYYELEGRGFERDLRGIPIGRVPYAEISSRVQSGQLTKQDAEKITSEIEEFVRIQAKSNDTSMVLDSAPYVAQTDSGESISSTMKYGIELLTGGSTSFAEIGAGIDRTNRELARVLGTEHLLLGDATSGSRAMSEDKSQKFYLIVNGSLDEITDAMNDDIITPICELNGIPEELWPKFKHSEVSFRTVMDITTSLMNMAHAGAVLAPNDPAIDDVRDLLGLSRPPDPTAEMMGADIGGNITDTEENAPALQGQVKPDATATTQRPAGGAKPASTARTPPKPAVAAGNPPGADNQSTPVVKTNSIILKAESGDQYILELEEV